MSFAIASSATSDAHFGFFCGKFGPWSSVLEHLQPQILLYRRSDVAEKMVPTTYGGTGVASTSVPVWDGRDVKNGTSMSAPQVAGDGSGMVRDSRK